MNQLSTLILFCLPALCISQTAFSPFHDFFDERGQSRFGEMALDSIDVFSIRIQEVKITYDDYCKVSGIDYLENVSDMDTFNVTYSYHDNGLPSVILEIESRFGGSVRYDTTWLNDQARVTKHHSTNSNSGSFTLREINYDEQGRIIQSLFHQVNDVDGAFLEVIDENHITYVSEDEFHEDFWRHLLIENPNTGNIDTIESMSTTVYISEEGRPLSKTVDSADGQVVTTYTYDDEDRITERAETYNGTLRHLITYEYSNEFPICPFWTNNTWTRLPDQEVVITTTHDRRHGDLAPHEFQVKATDLNGNTTYEERVNVDAFGNYDYQFKSLEHHDENGDLLYDVVFIEDGEDLTPYLLAEYENNSQGRPIHIEFFNYDLGLDDWGPLAFEIMNEYDNVGRLISRVNIIDGEEDRSEWSYTDFGAINSVMTAQLMSQYYYGSQVCTSSVDPVEKASAPLVYPNPTASVLFLHEVYSVPIYGQLFNTEGKLLQNMTINPGDSYNVEMLYPGIYILELVLPDGSISTQKIIKI